MKIRRNNNDLGLVWYFSSQFSLKNYLLNDLGV